MDVHQDVLALLQGKQRCLRQLISISRNFLDDEGACSDGNRLAAFDGERTSIFKAIELIDRQIHEATARLSSPEVRLHATESWITAMKFLAENQQSMANEVQELDQQIIRRMEQTGEALLQEIRGQNQIKNTLSKFKSQWVQGQGEELDQKL